MTASWEEVSFMYIQFSFVPLTIVWFLLALLACTPDLYLDELTEELEVQHGVAVSISTVWHTIQRLGLAEEGE